MSNQRASCCGASDEVTPEPAKVAETTNRAGDGRVVAPDTTSRAPGSSGLIQAVRRLFGRAPA